MAVRATTLLCLFLLQCVATSAARIPNIRLPSQRRESIQDVPLDTRPLIGILSQPGDGYNHETNLTSTMFDSKDRTSYIAASYVKFVESGGARAVPIIWNEPEETLRKKFAAINGILLPGGGTSLQDTPFYRVTEKIYHWALEANDRGDYFPIYGVCLGFELLSILATKNHDILEPFDAENNPGPLLFVDEWAKRHSLFEWVPLSVVEEFHTQNLAMQNHHWGLSPELWSSTPELNDFYRVLTVSPDRNNKLYISTVEARDYPILGVQWHPEKNAYEWGIDNIPHSADAIKVTQSVANYFIAEARKSAHRPASRKQEEDFLIYNYNPVYVSKDGKGTFDQAYIFN
ncbi:hypothetical protein KC19_10G033500 [Ceratodon purpureus]|uniref:folate gamma-glutamyl hydrolase n=1 Tax=Ceratodon purpureus TaxID=3225 RepID=A0A8T0GIX8_CERPU|nr:hypothetical protein KC19_10G033500 [Ceratodon purpureus]KAG0558507.1 hypothetical protein KC19_10G033500 [Ceratodon purpureus]KAG0558508.1 hypothetical protein KC19_10G033500 [Ceratodon purpureus]